MVIVPTISILRSLVVNLTFFATFQSRKLIVAMDGLVNGYTSKMVFIWVFWLYTTDRDNMANSDLDTPSIFPSAPKLELFTTDENIDHSCEETLKILIN